MRLTRDGLTLSPTDLSNFLSCRHRNGLELSVAYGVRKRPVRNDPLLETLSELGLRHEREYVSRLQKSGRSFLDLAGEENPRAAVARTLEAMRSGVEVIVQAGLGHGRWYGEPDLLMKVDRCSSRLGSWSYEPADTKLARETRGGTILQLGIYCALLEAAQGLQPERFHVISPAPERESEQVVRSYRTQDYAAYLRLMRAKIEDSITKSYTELESLHLPDPVDHCAICPWYGSCQQWWRAQDHLSLVAGISRLQRRDLPVWGIGTVSALAQVGTPLPFKAKRGSAAAYERVRDQARVQIQSRVEQRLVYELISTTERTSSALGPLGLARLPEPSPGDVFLDLEGDALSGDGGREYLFGLVTVDQSGEESYQSWWSFNQREERLAFEAVVDLIVARLETFPDLHIYHYAPYEPSAFKRLMGRYATRERELDGLLRAGRFVDLYGVVRQALRVGVERYSIKNLEPLYEFERKVELRDAGRTLKLLEQAIELDRLDVVTERMREVVQGYNQDDCVSTRRLRDWLELRRAELAASGPPIDRPLPRTGEASEDVDDKALRVEVLRGTLLHGVSMDPRERAGDRNQEAMYQLAYMLDWHRREEKSGHWEFFRLRDLPSSEMLDERKGIGQLLYEGDLESRKRSVVRRFRYPEQEAEITQEDTLFAEGGRTYGKVVEHDVAARTLDMLVGPKNQDLLPSALFVHENIQSKVIVDAVFALGQRTAITGRVDALAPCPERSLLLREAPSLISGTFSPPSPGSDLSVTDYATQIVTQLDRTALAIQGPPGSGKTFTGARMVTAAIRAGLRVGVTATSHKVINHLLKGVAEQAAAEGIVARLAHRQDTGRGPRAASAIRNVKDYSKVRKDLESGSINVLGGTAWLWAREEFEQSVDLLFVDEAGQVALANVLGVARAARSVILLGDPQQLEQPSKGSHPDGIGLSALQYVLGGAETMPPDRGLFLPVTWRLAPAICQFTSELFYAGQLTSKSGLERQALVGGPFEGSGLRLVEVDHVGNSGSSDEEAAEVVRIVSDLIDNVHWSDQHGTERSMTTANILVVAPFNAHVHRISEALHRASLADVQVGTVDKFQGQEAPVAIYAMATSHPEDAPRGMEFLYSLNRLNVATSRARCAAIIIASPRLFEPDCQTPRQMKLANALCRFRELARRSGSTR